MSEILLVRHAKSHANARSLAFGNEESPLDEKGVGQAEAMADTFRNDFGIDPATYGRAVLSSHFVRPQETAWRAGFRFIATSPILREGEIPFELLEGSKVIDKHAQEGWIPDILYIQAERFLGAVRTGELPYQIYFTHGLFIAAVVQVCSDTFGEDRQDFPHGFDENRGYIPGLATITQISS